MKWKKLFARFIRIVRDNYILVTIVLSIFVVLGVLGFRLFASNPENIYVKVKVSQGLWWANTARPNYWYINSIKKGIVQKDLAGRNNAEILSVRYYPYWDTNQYDVYVTLKLIASQKDGEFVYDRITLGAGAPIEFEFPATQFTGTVIAVSEAPFTQKLVDKTIVLQKTYAYLWEFDAIQIGEKYHDGEEDVFEVLDKQKGASNILSQDTLKNITGVLEQRNVLRVTARVKVSEENGQYIFGEEQILRVGRPMQIATNAFHFTEYQLVSIK